VYHYNARAPKRVLGSVMVVAVVEVVFLPVVILFLGVWHFTLLSAYFQDFIRNLRPAKRIIFGSRGVVPGPSGVLWNWQRDQHPAVSPALFEILKNRRGGVGSSSNDFKQCAPLGLLLPLSQPAYIFFGKLGGELDDIAWKCVTASCGQWRNLCRQASERRPQ